MKLIIILVIAFVLSFFTDTRRIAKIANNTVITLSPFGANDFGKPNATEKKIFYGEDGDDEPLLN